MNAQTIERSPALPSGQCPPPFFIPEAMCVIMIYIAPEGAGIYRYSVA